MCDPGTFYTAGAKSHGCFARCNDHFGGGGWASNFGKVSLMHAHLGALVTQIVAAGRARSGLSKVPARTINKCGRSSA